MKYKMVKITFLLFHKIIYLISLLIYSPIIDGQICDNCLLTSNVWGSFSCYANIPGVCTSNQITLGYFKDENCTGYSFQQFDDYGNIIKTCLTYSEQWVGIGYIIDVDDDGVNEQYSVRCSNCVNNNCNNCEVIRNFGESCYMDMPGMCQTESGATIISYFNSNQCPGLTLKVIDEFDVEMCLSNNGQNTYIAYLYSSCNLNENCQQSHFNASVGVNCNC
jgi:hypothetical protein